MINTGRGELVDPVPWSVPSNPVILVAMGRMCSIRNPHHPTIPAWCPRCVITPHVGSRTYESVARQAEKAACNLILAMNGEQPLAQANNVPIPTHFPLMSEDTFYIVPEDTHNQLVEQAYAARGFDVEEQKSPPAFPPMPPATVSVPQCIKSPAPGRSLWLKTGGCTPSATIERIPGRFSASEVWNCNKKLGQAVAYQAIDRCIELADQHGIGQVAVDQAFHYLGGDVMEAAKRGYLTHTNCTASVTEVVPFLGSTPTLGTNPLLGHPHHRRLGYPCNRLGNLRHRHGPCPAAQARGQTITPVPRWMPMAMKPPIPTPCMPSSPSVHTRDTARPAQ